MNADIKQDIGRRLLQSWLMVSDQKKVSRIVSLQEEKLRSVYRIYFTGSHPSIIAKLCLTEDAEHEYQMYSEVLPSLTIQGVQAYGCVPDTGSAKSPKKKSWLFMEDILGAPYDCSNSTHQRLAGRWLAQLHTSSGKGAKPDYIRERSTAFYAPHVQTAVDMLVQHRSDTKLSGNDRQVLSRIYEFFRKLETHWDKIEKFCRDMPQTLMHADFKDDNMFVVDSGREPVLVVFDWSCVGWGAPALDVAKFMGYGVSPDLRSYLEVCKQHWPHVDEAAIVRLGYIGEIFRFIHTVRWDAEYFNYGYPETAMSCMRIYDTWFQEIDTVQPWIDTDLVSSGKFTPMKKAWH